jgi:hypothetical protein
MKAVVRKSHSVCRGSALPADRRQLSISAVSALIPDRTSRRVFPRACRYSRASAIALMWRP